MKRGIIKNLAFIGKSILWALSLYVILMLAFNFDEINKSFHTSDKVVMTATQPDDFNKRETPPSNISQHVNAFKQIILLVKVICGFSASIGK